jgi:hypothetical protein
MKLICDRDDDRLNRFVGQHGIVVAKDFFRLVDGCDFADQVFGGIAEGVQLNVARLLAGLQMSGLSDQAGAQYANSQKGGLLFSNGPFFLVQRLASQKKHLSCGRGR